jgi:hypothetical protein
MILLSWNGDFVKRFMMRVSQLKVGEPLVLLDKTMTNDLNLWLMRDCGQVAM